MTRSDLFGIAGVVCVAGAVAGLAGLLWALLLVGAVLCWVAYVVHTAEAAGPPAEVADQIATALDDAGRRHDIDKAAALAAAEAEHTQRLEQSVKRYDRQLAEPGEAHQRELLKREAEIRAELAPTPHSLNGSAR